MPCRSGQQSQHQQQKPASPQLSLAQVITMQMTVGRLRRSQANPSHLQLVSQGEGRELEQQQEQSRTACSSSRHKARPAEGLYGRVTATSIERFWPHSSKLCATCIWPQGRRQL